MFEDDCFGMLASPHHLFAFVMESIYDMKEE